MGRYIVGKRSILGNAKGVLALNDFVSQATDVPSGPTSTMLATGGNTSTNGDYKIHTFTSSGIFNVTVGTSVLVEYLVIGGGGGGSNSSGGAGTYGGGGGGGGFLEYISGAFDGNDFIGYRVVVSAGDELTITIGAGGTNAGTRGNNGGASKITSPSRNYVVAIGGGGGGSSNGYYAPHGGASSGGNYSSSRESSIITYGGINYSPKQGWALNNQAYGCGAGWDGVNTNFAQRIAGRVSTITGNAYGAGAYHGTPALAGAANTGNSGEGGNQSYYSNGASGGSGIVVLRYKFQ